MADMEELLYTRRDYVQARDTYQAARLMGRDRRAVGSRWLGCPKMGSRVTDARSWHHRSGSGAQERS